MEELQSLSDNDIRMAYTAAKRNLNYTKANLDRACKNYINVNWKHMQAFEFDYKEATKDLRDIETEIVRRFVKII